MPTLCLLKHLQLWGFYVLDVFPKPNPLQMCHTPWKAVCGTSVPREGGADSLFLPHTNLARCSGALPLCNPQMSLPVVLCGDPGLGRLSDLR